MLGQVITAAEVWLSNGVVEEVVDLHGSFLVMKLVPSFSEEVVASDAIPQGSIEAPIVLGGGGGCSSTFLRSFPWMIDLAVGLLKSKSNKSLEGFAFCCSSALHQSE